MRPSHGYRLVRVADNLSEENIFTCSFEASAGSFSTGRFTLSVITVPPTFEFSPDSFDINASNLRSEATLLFVYKRVYIFLIYNCVF